MTRIGKGGQVRVQLFLAVAATVSLLGSIMAPLNASANFFDNWYGDGDTSEGYFHNGGNYDRDPAHRSSCGYVNGCPVLPNNDYAQNALDAGYYHGGNSSTAASVDRAHRLVGDLKWYYTTNPGNGWGATGAAFIVNTMLGRTSDDPAKTRSISNTDWNKVEKALVDRANKGKINWDANIWNEQKDTYTKKIDGVWDVVWNNESATKNGFVIYNDDYSVAYRLWYECANPVGNNSGLPEPSKEWNIYAQSYIKNSKSTAMTGLSTGTISAKPGDTLNWYHDLRNVGPDAMDRTVNVNRDVFVDGTNTSADYVLTASGGVNSLFVKLYANNAAYQSKLQRVVTQGDVGHTICQGVAWTPWAWNNGGWGHSPQACASVPYNYTIVPEITNITDNSQTVSGSGDLPVSGQLTNKGPTKTPGNIEWQITQVKYGPSKTIIQPGNQPTTNTACGYYTNWTDCDVLQSGKEVGGLSNSDAKTYAATGNVGSDPVGTRVCYVMSVKPAQSSLPANNWIHSQTYCLIVMMQPKVQVQGGDLFVGRGTSEEANVSTGVTKNQTGAVVIDAPTTAFSGLYKTGVRDNNMTPLSANAADTHWVIDRVYRPSGYGGNTCQKIVVGSSILSSTVASIPTTSSSEPLYARVISQANGSAGMYYGKSSTVTGDAVLSSVAAANGLRPWNRVDSKNQARWIGQNQYGQNYSANDCKDPTFLEPSNMAKSNIYVFKLKNGFTIDPNAHVDLNSIKLSLGGGFDNVVKFFVNGHDMGPGQEPGWGPGSTATAESTATKNAGIFKNGKNELEIHIQSTYSHTGILIDNFTITAKALQSDNKTYGSWDEYAIAPSGTVKGMASASGYAGGVTTSTLCSVSLLTFTNANKSGSCVAAKVGNYSISSASPATTIANRFTADGGPLSGTVSLQALASGKTYPASGNITLTSSAAIPKGKWVVIKAPNSIVTIGSNIQYTTDTLANVGQIPQVVIIAKNIIVKEKSVLNGQPITNVDSWLVATGAGADGYLKTCDADGINESTGLTSNVCSSKLTVNGPVIVNHLYMYRTAGGVGVAAGDPAEVFNLRPDAYLWASNLQSASGKVRTVQTTELPPRF
jgi:hypothetical protein